MVEMRWRVAQVKEGLEDPGRSLDFVLRPSGARQESDLMGFTF